MKINKFAQLNAKYDDIKDQLKIHINQKKNLEEACEELALVDDTELVPYLIGEIFVNHTVEEVLVSI